MNISSGVLPRAQKVVVYGPEGIGKSTFAGKFPDPLFLDIEGSTGNLSVRRISDPITTWPALVSVVQEVNSTPSVCKTLVIDTADWAERLCLAYVCGQHHKKGIEDFGYGAGYTYLLEEFARFLEVLNITIGKGVNVVMNAHATIRKFEQPDEMGAYDRWELKLNKKTTNQTAAIVKEWADMLLFANYKTNVITEGLKKKAVGNKRVMYTEHTATWDAKNRHQLPPELPFDFAEIARCIPGTPEYISPSGETPGQAQPIPAEQWPTKAKKEPAKPAAAKKVKPAPKPEPVPPEIAATLPNAPALKKLADLMTLDKVTDDEIKKAVSLRGYYPEDTEISAYDPEFIEGCLIGAWDQIKEFIVSKVRVPF